MDTPLIPSNAFPNSPPSEVDEIVQELNYPRSVVKVAEASCCKTRAELLFELREEVKRIKWGLGMKKKSYSERKRELVGDYGEQVDRKREMMLADEIERRALQKKYLESIKNVNGESRSHSRKPPSALKSPQNEECRSQSPTSDDKISSSSSKFPTSDLSDPLLTQCIPMEQHHTLGQLDDESQNSGSLDETDQIPKKATRVQYGKRKSLPRRGIIRSASAIELNLRALGCREW